MNWLSLLWQIPVGLLVLSFLVLIHELGHFIVAKRNGVTVNTFSIGFGPKLWSFERGGTIYQFAAIPFGGYVAMAGEQPGEDGGDDPGAFDKQSIGVRARIAFAGPAVNIVFALLAVWVLSMVGVHEPVVDRVVVASIDPESPAARAGIRPGDTVLSAGKRVVRTWDALFEVAALSKDRDLPLRIQRDGREQTIVVRPVRHPEPLLDVGYVGMLPGGTVLVQALIPGSAAEKAGVKAYDTILAVNGSPLRAAGELSAFIQKSEGKPVVLLLGRAQGRIDQTISPRFDKAESRWLVGIMPADVQPHEFRRYGPIAALERSARKNWENATAIFRVLGALFQARIAARSMSGPVGIVQMAGRVAAEGLQSIIEFMALLSINLGVLNLLPLVITDGGKLLELAIEKVRGRPAPRRLMEALTNATVVAFILLALYITFWDVRRIPMFLR